MKLQGIYPPVTTPFQHDGELYPAKIRHNVEKWNQTAVSGYVVAGSTGESVLLSTAEKLQLWEAVAGAAAAGKTLIAGTGVDSVVHTVNLTNQAAELGYHAALIKTPHYYKNQFTRDDAQLLYFRSVADRVKIPVLIYNFPQLTGVDISAGAIVALSEHPNIVGVKESSGNLEKVSQLVREVKNGFQVLVGSAPTFFLSLQAGVVGGILAFANAAPYAAITIWEAHRSRDWDAARDWQNRIAHAAWLVTTKHGIPGLKHAMDLNGYYGGPARLPLAPLGPPAREEIESAFRDLRG